MVHTGISTGCATCHDTGKSFTGVTNLKTKPSNHVPTSATCETCHSATNFTTFAGTAMNHTGIASGCTTCHAASPTGTPFAGVTPKPQGSGHIPTTADCTTCHKSTTAFGPGTAMVHTGITSGCATCHETGKSFTGVTIVTRPTDPNHPVDWRLQRLPQLDHLVQDRGERRQAGEPHSHDGGVHAVPHQPGLLQARGDEPYGDHERLHDLPRTGTDRDAVLRGDAEAAGHWAHPDHLRLHRLPQVHDRVRSGDADGAHRHHQRLRDVPRHRQELHRGYQPQDQAIESRADDGDVRDLPLGDQLHQLRRHGDESYRHQLRLHNLPRGKRDGDAVRRGDAEAAGTRPHPARRRTVRPATSRRRRLVQGR